MRRLAVAASLFLAGPALAGDLNAAIALFQQGRYAEAETQLQGVAGPDASAYLSAVRAKQKKYAEAEQPAMAALAANPVHPVAIAGLGEALVGLKRYDDAINQLTTALGKKNDLAYAYFWRAQAYYAKKQPDKMVGDFQTFLKLAPNAPEAATVRQLLATLH